MTKLISLIVALAFAVLPQTESKTTVSNINEDDQVAVLVKYKGEVKKRVLHRYDFNVPVILAEDIPTEVAVGKFTTDFLDSNGKQYYQFKSNDDAVWWALTEKEIGFKPVMEKEYALLYCNNGTTKQNKPCDCIPDWECECELYDDVFIEIYEEEQK